MSEAEQSAEVEDVLSSIRRLVADRPRVVSERPKTEDTAIQNDPDPEPAQEPTSFVETMNASIAEITKETQTEQADTTDAQTRVAHVNAFLANEEGKPSEISSPVADADQEPAPQTADEVPEPAETTPKKPETLVLRADMAADLKPAPQKPVETDIAENVDPVLNDDDAQAEYEAASQNIPEDLSEDIIMPEIVEHDEPEDTIEAAAQFVDEDTLRELVSEMVRAELQGDLGDRITRNVRKLVRREIHHALTARDFE
jgi:hypothetical protein